MMKTSRNLFLSVCSGALAFYAVTAQADVKLPVVFTDHMVLQREQAVPVWGEAKPGEKVSVKFRDQEKSAVADDQGRWTVKLDPLKAGGPDKLIVTGDNQVEIDDVLVGEVWIGSGQSNMAMGLSAYTKHDPALAALAAAAPYPRLRLFGINGPWQMQATSRWELADAAHLKHFSALLFAFGVRLQKELDVPVGLIVAAASGSPSGAWLTREALQADPDCQALIKAFAAKFDQAAENQRHEATVAKWKEAVETAKAQNKPQPGPPCPARVPGELYCKTTGEYFETYLRPVVPFGMRGVLWDQGENGTGLIGLSDHGAAMRALIRGWRQEWGQPSAPGSDAPSGDFPFLYVQKASGGGCAWDYDNPVTAKADPFTPLPQKVGGQTIWGSYLQLMTFPNTFMVISSDLGAGQHPVNKSGYGHRAADVALGAVYDKPIEYYGPMYESYTVEGDKVRVRFTHVGKGLAFKRGEKLQGFALSQNGGLFYWADAVIDGDTVVVSCPQVSHPVAVEYGWSGVRPWANLFNKDGLPAVPFRTTLK